MCSIMFGFTHFSPKNVTLRLLYASSKKCFRSLYIGNRTQTQAFIYIYIKLIKIKEIQQVGIKVPKF